MRCKRQKDGGVQFDVMGRCEIDAIRDRMRPAKEGLFPTPWDTDYPEMARKTVIRRLCKSLRLKIETQTALAEALDKSDLRLDGDVIEVSSEETPLADKVKERGKAAEKPIDGTEDGEGA